MFVGNMQRQKLL